MLPESVESLCAKARQAVAQREHEQARQLYLQALGVKADSPDVHYGLATVSFLLGDLQNAAYHFKEVTRLDPLRAGAFINLGAVYNRLDQVEEAILALRRGIQLDTHRAEGYYNLGLAYKRKKQLDLAIQAYHEAVRLNPKMPDAHLNLGNAYLDKGQFGLAQSHYRNALEIRPDWEKAESGFRQAEAGLAAARSSIAAAPQASAATAKQQSAPTASASAPLDPTRQVDPNTHGHILTSLHRATIESDTQGRGLLTVLEKELEPAIKELSSCLLYANSPIGELEECVTKFEAALSAMKGLHRSLVSSNEQVRSLGERLVRN
jgi:Flp pilus assembly protein TadD